MISFSKVVMDKVAALPDQPGVYLMRNRQGKIIYIGKAASLRSRTGSYFRASTFAKADPKLRGLIRSIEDFDIIPLKTAAEAALTESRLIKEYRPRYNILLKDDKRFLTLRIHPGEPFPKVEAVRLRKEDGARYWGPYASTAAARATVEFVQRRFGLRTCRARTPGEEDHKHCHADQLRFCAAPCLGGGCGNGEFADYRARTEAACGFLDGDLHGYLADLKKEMEAAAAERRFEKAAALRDTCMLLLKGIRERATAKKGIEVRKEEAMRGVRELGKALGMRKDPRWIECYDISNISGTHSVASGVVSIDGVPTPARYRRYRIRTVEGANDPASMAEVIRRRFERVARGEAEAPDLVIVDGGITQLRAARRELDALGFRDQALAGLAERFEELYWDVENKGAPLRFAEDSAVLRVLQQIRDEAHRFAITYHRKLRARAIRESVLDDVPGIGPAKKAALLRAWGSVGKMREASVAELAASAGLGERLAAAVHAVLASAGGDAVKNET